MNKQCEIVQDLLPLYVDGACSESSTEMVKEHLESCPECKTLYEKLCSDTGEETLKDEMVGVVAKHEKKVKKKILFWAICYILSISSLISAFPILLFTFYPYSIMAVAIYTIAMVIMSVLSFRKSTIRAAKIKQLLFVFLLIPIITLIAVLVSIETGWLHFPG